MIKEGGKSRKGKRVVRETTQGLSKAGSCCHPQGWRDSWKRHLHQRVHPLELSVGAGLSEWGPQSKRPDCKLTLSSVPVTLWCTLHPVHLLLTQLLPSPPTTSGLFPDTWDHVPAHSVHGNFHKVSDLTWELLYLNTVDLSPAWCFLS